MPRFFSEESLLHLTVGAVWRLPDAMFHHAVRVRRLRVGEVIALFDGSGAYWRAAITHIDKRGAVVVVEERVDEKVASFPLTLVLSMFAIDRMDWALQKGTELGVQVFQPVYSVHSAYADKKREEKRLAHWRNVAIAACEQCGRNVLPELRTPVAIDEVLTAQNQSALRIVLDADTEKSLMALLHEPMARAAQEAVCLVGPEGGFSREEVALARQHHWQIVHLGPRILRAETAVIATAALVQAAYGDFRKS